ncbi:MAG: OPT/YSL family transporter [Myxococcales bacterium]|nr:OPT/YSL family transporter [Myxococcales bacterium]MCB9577345.1 OPT/YSL family transporter [Polyangiaceae bacterium]
MSEGTVAYREITVGAVVLGVVQGMLMTAAFVYIGLKLGFGLAGSSVAAILGFALLRGVGRNVFKVQGCGSIVENNINQTIASGVNTASAGIVFTFPALLLLGLDYSFVTVLFAAIAGSFMGIVVIIPLRKQLIEIERLKFPSGVAVATILKTPGAGIQKAKYLGIGFAISALLTLATNHRFHLIPEAIPVGPWLAKSFGVGDAGPLGLALIGTTIAISMANIGAGMLAGRGGLAFAVGGMMAWWIVGPFVVSQGWAPPKAVGEDLVGAVYGTMLRPTGIGILIGGALAGVVAAFPAIKGAVASLSAAAKLAREGGQQAEELSPKVLVGGLIASVLALMAVTIVASIDAHGGFHIGTAVTAAVAGAIWIALAGLIVAQATGATDISPLSGLALIAVTLMLAITGGNVVVAVTIGIAVCIATNQCADMMTDLKTGHLIGGVPRRQQLAQFAVAWVGPAIAIGTTILLWKSGAGGTNGFGPESTACVQKLPGCLPAPQASVLQGMIQGVLSGQAPVDKYVAGAVIGAGLSLFPIGGLGVLIGLAMYLPFDITLGYGIGCLISMGLERWKGHRFVSDAVVPIAAGFIVGEALTALGMTLIELMSGGGA